MRQTLFADKVALLPVCEDAGTAGIRGITGWVGVVLDAPDARRLAYFYRDLFGWSLAADEPNWCTIRIPEAPANSEQSCLCTSLKTTFA